MHPPLRSDAPCHISEPEARSSLEALRRLKRAILQVQADDNLPVASKSENHEP